MVQSSGTKLNSIMNITEECRKRKEQRTRYYCVLEITDWRQSERTISVLLKSVKRMTDIESLHAKKYRIKKSNRP